MRLTLNVVRTRRCLSHPFTWFILYVLGVMALKTAMVLLRRTQADNSRTIRLLLRDERGDVILDKDVTSQWNAPLRRWNCSRELLVFLHIPKSGGTSLRESLRNSYRTQRLQGCREQSRREQSSRVKVQDPADRSHLPAHLPVGQRVLIPAHRRQACERVDTCASHFDWGTIEGLEALGVSTAPVVLLRDPVERFISNFYYVKSNDRWQHARMIPQNLSEFLSDPQAMMEARGIWHDGQAAVSWLSGMHMYRVGHTDVSRWSVEERETLSQDWSYMLNRAIHYLHRCVWVGILEEMDQSLKLLEHQTDLSLHLGHLRLNQNKPARAQLTQSEVDKISALMPKDMYLYKYAKLLHGHRWQQYLKMQQETEHISINKIAQNLPGGVSGGLSRNSEPYETLSTVTRGSETLPTVTRGSETLPTVIRGCKSTRYRLTCPGFSATYQGPVLNLAPGVDTLCNVLCNAPYILDLDLHVTFT